MKKICIILLTFHSLFFKTNAQTTPASTFEQKLENLTDADQVETEDDSYLQLIEKYSKQPLNLNLADENELKETRVLSALQIANFITYRKLMGKFISIYELQSIPSWDIQTIRRLLPFITISDPVSLPVIAHDRFRGGEHFLQLRYSQILEEAKGYNQSTPGTKYLGGPQRLFFRYQYQNKDLIRFGITSDKDAGEQFFRGAQKAGFDFYSFHFIVRKIGIIQSLVLGDFTVNMGQGLIQWQSLAFRKSVEVLGIKRQSAVIRPYNSAGEFNFHRGAAITIQKGKLEATAFASFRKLSANFSADTISYEEYVTSIINSGYHRTSSEVDNRNKLGQTTLGGNLRYRLKNGHIGMNAIQFIYSDPIQKDPEPYNLYAISGKTWGNYSIDYSYTHRNIHFFGEAATDKNLNTAFVNGLLVSVDPRVDLSFLYRNISKQYQSVNGNAFTENTYPTNEKGFFTGITIRPASTLRLDAYFDIFNFPWLKYQVDAPSFRNDFLAQLTYAPNRQVELYTRIRSESRQINQPDNTSPVNYPVSASRIDWRTQLFYRISPSVTLRTRTELLWYDRKGPNEENGFLTYFDFFYKPQLKPYGINLRLQYFETDDYDSRIYAYENDVLYYYSIPAFFDHGVRYYINMNVAVTPFFTLWLKWSQTFYKNKETIGSGLDEIPGSRKSEIRLMGSFNF